jgi:hypothetical protein
MALVPGREGVALAQEVLDATLSADAAFDAVIRELVVAMNDLAQVVAAAAHTHEREALLLKARPIAERSA